MTQGFVPGNDVSLRTMEIATRLSDCPLPISTRQLLTNGLPPTNVVIVFHLTFIRHRVVPQNSISPLWAL